MPVAMANDEEQTTPFFAAIYSFLFAAFDSILITHSIIIMHKFSFFMRSVGNV